MSRTTKVLTWDELRHEVAEHRKTQGARVVLSHGVFDSIHVGHARHLKQAKALGTLHIVAVTPALRNDVDGPGPVFPPALRAEAVAAMDSVDWAVIAPTGNAVDSVDALKPDVYARPNLHGDSEALVDAERAACRRHGTTLTLTEELLGGMSTEIQRYLEALSVHTRRYLAGFARRHNAAEVMAPLKAMENLRVLCVGETIVDEYVYSAMIGKSAKEPILAVRSLDSERFAGGILAVANHVAGFSKQVGVMTMLGEHSTHEAFVRERVNPKIKLDFIIKSGSPTVLKRRYVEKHLMQKLFEVYEMQDDPLLDSETDALCQKLEAALPHYDVVIVVDYGHGMLTQKAVDLLCTKAKFLAVNTQSNAGNKGLNTISKYPRVDFACLARHEIVLEERHRRGNLQDMVLSVSKKTESERVMVTLSKDGVLGFSRKEGFAEVPAFATRVVDRVGTGDAVLSIGAMCAALGTSMEITGFIANVVGAEAVATVGHRTSIDRQSLTGAIDLLISQGGREKAHAGG